MKTNTPYLTVQRKTVRGVFSIYQKHLDYLDELITHGTAANRSHAVRLCIEEHQRNNTEKTE